jgi:hypothetical protein
LFLLKLGHRERFFLALRFIFLFHIHPLDLAWAMALKELNAKNDFPESENLQQSSKIDSMATFMSFFVMVFMLPAAFPAVFQHSCQEFLYFFGGIACATSDNPYTVIVQHIDGTVPDTSSQHNGNPPGCQCGGNI